jgi:hypothetical protein
MAQATVQAKSQAATHERDRLGRWRPGQSGNWRGSRLHVVRKQELQASIELELGELSAVDRIMVQRAAELLSRRPRSHEQAVRLVNAASRIIDRLRAKHQRDDHVPSLAEYEAAS